MVKCINLPISSYILKGSKVLTITIGYADKDLQCGKHKVKLSFREGYSPSEGYSRETSDRIYPKGFGITKEALI